MLKAQLIKLRQRTNRLYFFKKDGQKRDLQEVRGIDGLCY